MRGEGAEGEGYAVIVAIVFCDDFLKPVHRIIELSPYVIIKSERRLNKGDNVIVAMINQSV